MRRINSEEYNRLYSNTNPNRYELRKGSEPNAPNCPFGNNYQWIGYDLETQEYVRFTKSIFKKLVSDFF